MSSINKYNTKEFFLRFEHILFKISLAGLANYGYQTQMLHRQSQTMQTSTPLARGGRTSNNNNDIYGSSLGGVGSTPTGGVSTLIMSESLVAQTSKLHEPIYVGYGDAVKSATKVPVYEPRKKSKSAKISSTTTTLHGIGAAAKSNEEELYAKRNITHV